MSTNKVLGSVLNFLGKVFLRFPVHWTHQTADVREYKHASVPGTDYTPLTLSIAQTQHSEFLLHITEEWKVQL